INDKAGFELLKKQEEINQPKMEEGILSDD